MSIEFELKIPAKLNEIRSSLQQQDAKKLHTDINQDTYLNHPTRDFATTDEALRIRKTKSNKYITYKGPKFDQKSKSRREINVEFEGEQSDMLQIFTNLGFVSTGEVIKHREEWILDEITITLDKVQDLGEFVEFEIVSSEKENLQIYIDKLKAVARKLGLDPENQITKSYLELLEEKQ